MPVVPYKHDFFSFFLVFHYETNHYNHFVFLRLICLGGRYWQVRK